MMLKDGMARVVAYTLTHTHTFMLVDGSMTAEDGSRLVVDGMATH